MFGAEGEEKGRWLEYTPLHLPPSKYRVSIGDTLVEFFDAPDPYGSIQIIWKTKVSWTSIGSSLWKRDTFNLHKYLSFGIPIYNIIHNLIRWDLGSCMMYSNPARLSLKQKYHFYCLLLISNFMNYESTLTASADCVREKDCINSMTIHMLCYRK